MRSLLTLTIATVATLGTWGTQAGAHAPHDAAVINGWYERYLGRPADACGLTTWSQQLHCAGPEAVQAGILASEEYWCRTGHTPVGFVTGLYADVLGRQAHGHEVRDWIRKLRQCGSRERLALDFMICARTELAQRAAPVYAPAPVFQPAVGFRGVIAPAQGVRFQARYTSPR